MDSNRVSTLDLWKGQYLKYAESRDSSDLVKLAVYGAYHMVSAVDSLSIRIPDSMGAMSKSDKFRYNALVDVLNIYVVFVANVGISSLEGDSNSCGLWFSDFIELLNELSASLGIKDSEGVDSLLKKYSSVKGCVFLKCEPNNSNDSFTVSMTSAKSGKLLDTIHVDCKSGRLLDDAVCKVCHRYISLICSLNNVPPMHGSEDIFKTSMDTLKDLLSRLNKA